MLIVAGITTYFLRIKIISAFRPVLFEFNLPFLRYFYLVVFVSLVFVGAYAISGLYSLKTRRGLMEEFSKILVASSAGIMMVIVYIFLRQELFDSRFLVLGGWFFAIVFVFIGRIFVKVFQLYAVSRSGFGVRYIVIVGNDTVAQRVKEEISLNPLLGYRVVSQLGEPDIQALKAILAVNTVGTERSCEDLRHIPVSCGVDEVLLTNSDYPELNILELVNFCHENHIVFKYIPNMHKTLTTNFDVDIIGGLPLIELKRTRLDGWGKVIKRTIDIFASILAIVLLSPLYIALGIIVKVDSEGPAFVKLKRISRNKEFKLVKFRSMVENAEELKASLAAFNERKDGPLFKMKDDPRITRVGKFIRRCRIDELPQFWNVLAGDISLVGPRPHQPDEISLYQRHHKKVLAIKAGATGLAQASGSSDLTFEQEVALDTFYVENWSLWLDVKIIAKTILKIFFDKSAV